MANLPDLSWLFAGRSIICAITHSNPPKQRAPILTRPAAGRTLFGTNASQTRNCSLSLAQFMKLRILTAALSFAAVTMLPTAHAQYYGGVVLSGTQARSEFGFNGSEKPSELVDLYQLARGLTLSPEPSVGMKLGYRFTPYFSVEGRYANRAAATSRALFQRDGLAAREKSMGLDLVGSLPVFRALLLEGRAGFRTENLNGVDSVGTAALGQRSLGTGALGVGVQYNFNSSLGLRFEAERSRKFFSDRGNNDAENVMLGVHWRF
ncbi:MAG TPA: hypothetical protein DEX10_04610 [Betaproteobacteria bacterium]|nr:hypothetical protein [Betaproteobacteria bacterium]